MHTEPTLQSLFGDDPYAMLVAQTSEFAIFFMDSQGRVVSWNEGARRLFGYQNDEIVGQPCDLLFVTEDRQAGVPQQELQKARQEGRAEDVRWHLRKDGNRLWINGVVKALRDEAEQLQGFAKIAFDDTPRKQAQMQYEEVLQQLSFERGRMATIIATSPAFVAVLRGEEHIFEMANPNYYQLVGHRDIIGKSLREALPEIEGQGFAELLGSVLHTGQPFKGAEMPVQLQRAPGAPIEERFVDLLYQPLFEADGTISGVFAHGVDVTNQVRARLQVEEVSRLKDEFLATLSHELRTPLSAIMGWAQLLQSGELSLEDTTRGLGSIERNARAQSLLIEDILDVSRVITGKMHLEVQPVDLVKVIEEAVSTALSAAQAKGIRLQRVLDADANVVLGDSVRLGQIVWNLVSNAIKFTPQHGRVQIRLEHSHAHVEIIVSDNGIGIAPNVLPYVFDRFRQADSSSTRAHGGLGLGLAIVRHLAELHGGSVEVFSEGLGQGSTFTLKLPLAPAHTLDTNRAEPCVCPRSDGCKEAKTSLVSDGSRLDGVHALVVDDQPDARMLLSVVLGGYGTRVTVVASAPEALAALQEQRPDVLLSDIGMPGEDGYSLIQRVRALSPEQGGQTPAIALTAFARAEDRIKALRAGFQNYLSKPVDTVELITLIESLLGRGSQPK